MCDPVTISLIAGTALTAGGQIQAGVAADKAGKANARVQQILADDAISRGTSAELSKRRETAARAGRQAAVFGAQGGEINTGSAAEILADTAEFGELDALRIRNNAEREAFGFESAGAIAEAQGANAKTSALFSAGGTLLTGTAKVGAKFATFKADNPGSGFGDFLRGRPPAAVSSRTAVSSSGRLGTGPF